MSLSDPGGRAETITYRGFLSLAVLSARGVLDWYDLGFVDDHE
jgi:hypothetical protein